MPGPTSPAVSLIPTVTMLRGWLSSKKAALVPGSSSPSVDVVTESRDLEEAMKGMYYLTLGRPSNNA